MVVTPEPLASARGDGGQNSDYGRLRRRFFGCLFPVFPFRGNFCTSNLVY